MTALEVLERGVSVREEVFFRARWRKRRRFHRGRRRGRFRGSRTERGARVLLRLFSSFFFGARGEGVSVHDGGKSRLFLQHRDQHLDLLVAAAHEVGEPLDLRRVFFFFRGVCHALRANRRRGAGVLSDSGGSREVPKHSQRGSDLEHGPAEVRLVVFVVAEPLYVTPESREFALGKRVAAVDVAARELELGAERPVFLAQSFNHQLGVGLLVHEQRVPHGGDAQRESTRRYALEDVLELGIDRGHHRRGAVPAERVLQQHGHHAVSIRHVGVAVAQRHDNLLERVQRQVDVLRLAQCAAADARLADALRPGEVHEVDLAAAHSLRAGDAAFHRHREHAVRTAGLQIHRGLGDGAVDVTQEQQIERVFLRARAVRRAPARVDHPVVILQQRDFR